MRPGSSNMGSRPLRSPKGRAAERAETVIASGRRVELEGPDDALVPAEVSGAPEDELARRGRWREVLVREGHGLRHVVAELGAGDGQELVVDQAQAHREAVASEGAEIGRAQRWNPGKAS